jgi:hypothetical protein
MLPALSAIASARNHRAMLPRLLDHLTRHNDPANWCEFLLVDSGSTEHVDRAA